MISTWVFFGYWGHLDYNAAAAAGRLASAEATHHNPDTPIGVPTRTWSAAYRDSETVDLVLVARPDMTWKMLAEGITGLQMLVFGGKELNFVITARGVEGHVGYGQMKRREAASGRGLAARVVRESGTTLPIVPAARTSGRKVYVACLYLCTTSLRVVARLTQSLQLCFSGSLHPPRCRHDYQLGVLRVPRIAERAGLSSCLALVVPSCS